MLSISINIVDRLSKNGVITRKIAGVRDNTFFIFFIEPIIVGFHSWQIFIMILRWSWHYILTILYLSLYCYPWFSIFLDVIFSQYLTFLQCWALVGLLIIFKIIVAACSLFPTRSLSRNSVEKTTELFRFITLKTAYGEKRSQRFSILYTMPGDKRMEKMFLFAFLWW